ncbi:hypothetical protein ACFOVU_16830 [Nocardiopsis sediminis]|uniref:D-isomer specific 2-hydroxyacid dehydrogenase catalytic domain-containing protein n=1 Tax=Nocardiopsis sediminis TaxID=1778267 RepID=A0ABV8FRU9_9ACTN
MRISVFEVEEWERTAFEQMSGEHEIRFDDRPLGPETAAAHLDADVVSTFIRSRADADVLGGFTRLGLRSTTSTCRHCSAAPTL